MMAGCSMPGLLCSACSALLAAAGAWRARLSCWLMAAAQRTAAAKERRRWKQKRGGGRAPEPPAGEVPPAATGRACFRYLG
eukprot:COSAG01_NODE_6713_length_3531_cov_18.112762_2_plen_81_part_00